MFGRKKTFDDNKKLKFAQAMADMPAIQLAVAPTSSIEDASGRINRKAIGISMGSSTARSVASVRIWQTCRLGVPVTFQVLRRLFPADEQAYTEILKPSAQGAPMGLARFIHQGDHET
jgi:hypothetical protein